MKGECNMALINCPECGKEVSDKAEVCIHCGYPLHDETQSNKEDEPVYLNEVKRLLLSGEKVKAIKLLRENTSYDLAEAIAYVDKLEQGQGFLPITKPKTVNEVKCPKCGSTQIQMVQRKWTPIMGIFTNKVDRVCMNCKHKF